MPISPHLRIYSFPFSVILSISNRISMLVAFFMTIDLVWLFIIKSENKMPIWLDKLIGSNFGYSLFIFSSYILFFNVINKVRYMIYSLDLGFDIKFINISGMLALLAALIMTLFLTIYV